VRQSPATKDVNTGVGGSTAAEAVTGQRPMITQQTEKTQYML
jgi:hypothetical protein